MTPFWTHCGWGIQTNVANAGLFFLFVINITTCCCYSGGVSVFKGIYQKFLVRYERTGSAPLSQKKTAFVAQKCLALLPITFRLVTASVLNSFRCYLLLSVFGIVTRLRARRQRHRDSIPGTGKSFLLESVQFDSLPARIKGLRQKLTPHPTQCKVKSEWNCTSSSPPAFILCVGSFPFTRVFVKLEGIILHGKSSACPAFSLRCIHIYFLPNFHDLCTRIYPYCMQR